MESGPLLATLLLAPGARGMVFPDGILKASPSKSDSGKLQLAPLDAHASEWGPDLASAYRREEPKPKPAESQE
ncbi:hypothetical protein F5Y13DRAFT_195568 [Hypoxylon sp. FL1857]|nr:hypothetical protein F5Y13DRAFT_195568 [Hypoxylon sp. FL1857]